CRDKWLDRAYYRDATTSKALSSIKRYYDWRRRPMTPARAVPGPNTDAKCTLWQPSHLTQQVNAERLVQILNGNARFNTSRGGWMWFNGRRFDSDYRGRVTRAAKRVGRDTWKFVREGLPGIEPKIVFKHATESEKATGIAAMMKLAETERGIPIREVEL